MPVKLLRCLAAEYWFFHGTDSANVDRRPRPPMVILTFQPVLAAFAAVAGSKAAPAVTPVSAVATVRAFFALR